MASVDARATGPETAGATTLLVIAGMHRSGTSALARSCNLLGVDLGDDFIPTRSDNQSGFWEDASVKDADDRALASHGMLWDDVRPLPRPWCDGFAGDEVRGRLRATLAALVRRGPLCGVKDPRISRLLPLWLPLLDELRVHPVFLVALREPGAVARSLERRDGLARARSLLLWLRYTLEAERDTRGRRRAFVCFDDLLADWRATLARAAHALGIAWPVALGDAAPAIERFLDQGLRHHVEPEAPGDELAALAQRAFAAVRALRDGESAALHAELDRVAAELEAAERAFGPLLHELERALVARRDGLTADAAEVRDVAEPGGSRTEAERELDRARREMLLAHELVARRDRELADAHAAFQRERDALAERIAAREAAFVAGEAALAAAVAESSGLRRDVDVLRRETEALRAERDAALAVVADVERSASWRLTAPLRALAAAARGGRKA